MHAGQDYIGVITPFFCHNGRGQFLFYRRGKEAKDELGVWDCSGGSMQFGEQPVETVLRKLKSQYGVEPVNFEELPAHSVLVDIDGIPNHWLAIPFIVQVDPEQVRIGEPHKMDEIGWFDLDALPEPIHPGAADILRTYSERFSAHTKKQTAN